MRAALAARIPHLHPVLSVSQADIDGAVRRGLLHLIGVSIDAMAGLFGARIPFITISCRTALRILKGQETGHPDWEHECPLWALALGAALESIDPGHLQAAMVADFARAEFVQHTIAVP